MDITIGKLWEYKIFGIKWDGYDNFKPIEDTLNKLGAEGWEAFAFYKDNFFIAKREAEDKV